MTYKKAREMGAADGAEAIEDAIARALDIARRYGGIDGAHHKMWVIDQMVRALTGCPTVKRTANEYETQGESEDYRRWVADARSGDDGPETYGWDVGITP